MVILQLSIGVLLLISLVTVYDKAKTVIRDRDACKESHEAAEFIANWSAGGMALGGISVTLYASLLVSRVLQS